jgi:hypothetical protein
VHLLVSEQYRFQNARCNNKKNISYHIFWSMLEIQVLLKHTNVLSDFTVMSKCLYCIICTFQKCKSNKQTYRPKAAEMEFLSHIEGKPKSITKTIINLKQFKVKRVGHNIITDNRVRWYSHILQMMKESWREVWPWILKKKAQQEDEVQDFANYLFMQSTLHVMDSLSIHHQELKTAHTTRGVCQRAAATCR